MRSAAAVLMLFSACFSLCIFCAPADADDLGLRLEEVNALNPDEGVSIRNYGSVDIDLQEYTICEDINKDPSYSITIKEPLIIHPGETVTLIKDSDSDSGFGWRHTTYVSGEGQVTFERYFALNNSGDDVYLFHGDTLVDLLLYGNQSTEDQPMWKGQTFTMVKGTFAIKKSSGVGSASYWFNYKSGSTDLFFDPDYTIDATVTPFLFPDSGGIPIYRALESAKSSVSISIYLLTSDNVCALLSDLASKGVSVTVLVERAPEGQYDPTLDSKRMKTMSDAGVEVLMIGGVSGDRYAYLHSKYCIIDEERVIVTSENWTQDNMCGHTSDSSEGAQGNRGWGVIVDSKEYAAYMQQVFDNDSDMSYGDVALYTELAPHAKGSSLTYTSPKEYPSYASYDVQITPVLSPDSSLDAQLYYIGGSTERAHIQQQSLGNDIFTQDGTVFDVLSERASRGVDCRFMLGSNSDSSLVMKINQSTDIKAASMDGPYLHNKGLICDDTVLVGSVNWTTTSFQKDREAMVAIHSAEVSRFYEDAFMEDFRSWYTYEGLTVYFTEIEDHYPSPQEIVVSVDLDQKGTFSYTWNLDGTEKRTTVQRTVLSPSVGDHVLTVTVEDSSGNTGTATARFTVDGGGSSFDFGSLKEILLYLLPVIVIAAAAIILARRMHRGGSRR